MTIKLSRVVYEIVKNVKYLDEAITIEQENKEEQK